MTSGTAKQREGWQEDLSTRASMARHPQTLWTEGNLWYPTSPPVGPRNLHLLRNVQTLNHCFIKMLNLVKHDVLPISCVCRGNHQVCLKDSPGSKSCVEITLVTLSPPTSCYAAKRDFRNHLVQSLFCQRNWGPINISDLQGWWHWWTVGTRPSVSQHWGLSLSLSILWSGLTLVTSDIPSQHAVWKTKTLYLGLEWYIITVLN